MKRIDKEIKKYEKKLEELYAKRTSIEIRERSLFYWIFEIIFVLIIILGYLFFLIFIGLPFLIAPEPKSFFDLVLVFGLSVVPLSLIFMVLGDFIELKKERKKII